jgi:hypothetical protein
VKPASSGEQTSQQTRVHPVQQVDFFDANAFVDLVNGGVGDAEFDHLRAHRGDEAAIGGAATGREFGRNTGNFFDSLGSRLRERAGWCVERLARDVPLERVANTMFLQDVFDDLFEIVDGLHRRVAQIEPRLEFAGDDVGGARTGVQIRDLKARGLEVFVAGIPIARREFGECRRECTGFSA